MIKKYLGIFINTISLPGHVDTAIFSCSKIFIKKFTGESRNGKIGVTISSGKRMLKKMGTSVIFQAMAQTFIAKLVLAVIGILNKNAKVAILYGLFL